MANTFTKNFQDGNALTEAQLNTAFTTIKPSLANMALATTGSSSFQIMRSKGSATAPEFDDIGDVLAGGTVTAAGANAVGSAMSATGANAVGNSMGASGANAVGNSIDSATAANNIVTLVDSASAANNILDNIDTSMTGVGATALFKVLNRNSAGLSATSPQIAISSSCGGFSTNSESFVDIDNLEVTITTTGRPVVVNFVSDGSNSTAFIQTLNSASSSPAGSAFKLLRGSDHVGTISIKTGTLQFATALVPPPGVILIDPVAAGTYTYKLQARYTEGKDTGKFTFVNRCRLIVHEL